MPLGEIFQDQTPVPLADPSLAWHQPPPEDFLDYIRTRTYHAFEDVPPDPETFLKPPRFMMAQAHRIWLTLCAIRDHLPADPDRCLLDLGAYPFSIDIAVRDYLQNPCRIVALANQTVPEDWLGALAGHRIELGHANLDPFVKAHDDRPAASPELLDAESESADMVLMSHVIEHLYHPLPVIQDAYRVLKEGGKLVITTDNAFLLGGLCNFLTLNDYLHDKLQDTSAMRFDAWRGHVRFFSMADLAQLVEHVGLMLTEKRHCEVMYHAYMDDYYRQPVQSLPKWRANILTEFPEYRNELILVAEK